VSDALRSARLAPAPPAPRPPDAPSAPAAGRYDRSIVEGPLAPAVWRLAWPTMLTNVIGGLQGIVDHVLVGHLVGFAGNAAIGVAWQIFLVVIAFVSSLFTGMGVLVARYAGANDADRVDRAVYQAFLTAIGLSVLVMAPVGYALSPRLLDLVNAAPAVRAEALPFLRVMFLGGSGMLVFFMLGGALRSAGDARTPMVLGIAMTLLNVVLNVVLIRGLGPVPAFGTVGAAMGTVIASGLVAVYAVAKLRGGGWVVRFPRGAGLLPDWAVIRALFRFGLPAGVQGIAMNVGGVLMLAFIGSLAESAAAQAAFAVAYSQLFSLITWTAVGLMGAAAAVAGQNLGAGRPDRAAAGVAVAARVGLGGAAVIGAAFLLRPRALLAVFGMREPAVLASAPSCCACSARRGSSSPSRSPTRAACRAPATRGARSTSRSCRRWRCRSASASSIQRAGTLDPIDVWLAILAGHVTRCALSVWRFHQGRWRHIASTCPRPGRRRRPHPRRDARATPPST
jgi:putative MATE family efflux protein